jgi:hypothetical protein
MSLLLAPRWHREMVSKTVSLFYTLRVTRLNPGLRADEPIRKVECPRFFAQERRKNEAGAGASWENDCEAIEGPAGKKGRVLHQTASDSRFGTRTLD